MQAKLKSCRAAELYISHIEEEEKEAASQGRGWGLPLCSRLNGTLYRVSVGGMKIFLHTISYEYKVVEEYLLKRVCPETFDTHIRCSTA